MNSKAIGTVFEKRVAKRFEELGFKVWRNLYIPWYNHYTQLDVLALRKDLVVCAECKCWVGVYDPFTDTYCRDGVLSHPGFFYQAQTHCLAFEQQIGFYPMPLVVVNDNMSITRRATGICHLVELGDYVKGTLANDYTPMFPQMTKEIEVWAHPTDAVVAAHKEYVERRKQENA